MEQVGHVMQTTITKYLVVEDRLGIKWHFDGFAILYVKALENLLDIPDSIDVEKTMPLIPFCLHAQE
jgi:hypothetical protein